MKTSELIGPALDWAIATCEGAENLRENPHRFDKRLIIKMAGRTEYIQDFRFSTNWAQGGPIIEREKYDLSWLPKMQQWYAQRKQHGTDGFVTHIGLGPTPLVAGLRCYVSSKLGDEIEIPKELK